MIAVLDANVLFPATIRDVLLSIADGGLIQPHWSRRIHDEWSRNFLQKNPHVNRKAISETIRIMDEVFPGASIEGFECWEALLELPDSDDRHVLAAAIEAQAEFIVTFNLSDFPTRELDKYAIQAISPDDFLCDLLQVDPPKVLAALKRQRARLKRPPKTPEEFIDSLDNSGLSVFASMLKDAVELL